MGTASASSPPVAERRRHELLAHGHTRQDPWHWLRDRDDPDVLAHLEAENRYTDAALAPLEGLREQLFSEIRGRVQEADTSAPTPDSAYAYYTRTIENGEYPILCRRSRDGLETGSESVLLDGNLEAEGHAFFSLGSVSVSPDHRILAYTTDTTGDERYTLRFRDLGSGSDFADAVANVYYGLAWADDSRSIFYTRPDDAVRPHQVLRHHVGDDPATDAVVLTEPDEHFFVSVRRSRSGSYVMIEIDSKTSSEALLVPTTAPTADPVIVSPRRAGVEYTIDHQRGVDGSDGRIVMLCNDTGPEFRLVGLPVDGLGASDEHREEILPHRAHTRLLAVDAFDRFLAVTERADATDRIRIIGPGRDELISQPEPVHAVALTGNREPHADTVRFEYTSLTTPPTTIDHAVATAEALVVKREPVLGRYDPSDYETLRCWAPADDGSKVPISLVRRITSATEGAAPLVLYGYGSYETAISPAFSYSRVGLLERGIGFAIAHVRGGGEMGRAWYDQGKLANKVTTFTDFISCAQHLIAAGYTTADQLVARGRSAGGLLMGALANLRPDLFHAIVAEVPFVDALTTMQDPSLPLTVTEWEEWGNPVADPAAYEYMLSYSPYDNVRAQAYPAILATAGLNDSRVQYWEPAKWVQRLRAMTTSDRPILLRCEMGAGHSGPSGRYASWREEAFALAFILDQLGHSH